MQYDQLVDRNSHRRNAEESLHRKSFYGQLKHIYVVTMPATQELCGPNEPPHEETLILAVIQVFSLARHRIAKSTPITSGIGRLEVVDMTTVQYLVGRIPQGKDWAIIDRTRTILPSFDNPDTHSDV